MHSASRGNMVLGGVGQEEPRRWKDEERNECREKGKKGCFYVDGAIRVDLTSAVNLTEGKGWLGACARNIRYLILNYHNRSFTECHGLYGEYAAHDA